MIISKPTWLLFFLFLQIALFAQMPSLDWYHESASSSPYNGIGTTALYDQIQNKRMGTPIVVAVIDSGVDTDHEDLKNVIWVNEDEIAGNGIDDDKNGYIDDIHGWNFIGSTDGKNVIKDTYEVTRLYGKYKAYFKNKDISKLSSKDKKLYKRYQEYEAVIEKERGKAQRNLSNINQSEEMVTSALTALEKVVDDSTTIDEEFVENFKTDGNQQLYIAKQILQSILESDVRNIKIGDLKKEIAIEFDKSKDHFRDKLNYGYNSDYNSREIVGDNYQDAHETAYGNNDVTGEFAFHGTHVSGIIAADRFNDLGMKGIADQAKIMAIRAVPDGDERDKDVANAIIYAVNNGASVINMSFGKGHSWNKKIVDKAVKYARRNDVLIVHAAGNSGQENNTMNNYPNAKFEKPGLFGSKRAKNWLEVGALSFEKGEDAIANFSNYGAKEIDLFAPGVYIYSTAPDNSYQIAQGTSMASPVVAGVAAMIRSYFPELKAREVKEILLESASPISSKVTKPGTFERVKATELSVSGGMVNAYAAFQMAEKKYKKRKNQKLKAQPSTS